MKKKFLALMLGLIMVATMAIGCNNDVPDVDPAPVEDTTPAPVEPTPAPAPEPASAEALPAPFAHLTFDGDDEGYKPVFRVDDDPGENTGGNHGITEGTANFVYAEGPVGNAIFLDGTYGLDLGLQPTNTDAYTVSFWVNAARLATYGATLQIGYNIGKEENAGNNVTWMNVTQSEWGEGDARIFPIVWSRNEASDAADGTDCWPWMYSFDNEVHGRREWAMVTIVASGEVQNGPGGATTVGAQYYINGELTYDSQANFTNSTYFEYTWDATLAPNIMKPGSSKFESWFGINYWDTIFRGFVDDLYFFDVALTPGQVVSLYELGDPTVVSEAPEAEEESEPAAQVVTTFDDSAIATVGSPECDNGFWSSFSDGYELVDGGTLTINFNNYGSGLNNWDNYVVAFTNTETTADLAPSPDNYEGYMEYGVLRSDAFGWAFPGDLPAFMEFDWDWSDFLAIMMNANVTLTFTRSGGDITMDGVVVDAEGNEYSYKMETDTVAEAGDSMFIFLTGEKCFIEILSVE